MNKYKVLYYALAIMCGICISVFGYGMERWIIGHWFDAIYVIVFGILTIGAGIGTYFFKKKAEEFEAKKLDDMHKANEEKIKQNEHNQ